MNADHPGIGHNQPPDPLIAEAGERVEAANAWLKITELANADQAARLATFVQQIDATHKALDKRRLAEGRAFKEQQDAIYNEPLSLMSLAKTDLVKLQKAWLAKEQARIAAEKAAADEIARKAAAEAEEAARKAAASTNLHVKLAAEKAAEAAAQAAAAAEAAPTRARIDASAHGGRTVAVKTTWHAKITSLSAALKSYAKEPIVIVAIEEAILKLANKEAAYTKNPAVARPGVEFYSTTT